MTLFKSLLYLGGLESIDSRIGEEEEALRPDLRQPRRLRTHVRQAGVRIRSVGASSRSRAMHSAPLGRVAGGCG